jgi:hypothetical protein
MMRNRRKKLREEKEERRKDGMNMEDQRNWKKTIWRKGKSSFSVNMEGDQNFHEYM